MNKQIVPVSLSLGIFIILSGLTWLLLHFLNMFPVATKIPLTFVWFQFFLGIFIYLKTSVDYALFVGALMDKNPGTEKRIAMNVGTQLGCFLGVTMIVVLWFFFKEIHWLMFILLIVAGCILIGLGDGSQEHFEELDDKFKRPMRWFFDKTRFIVEKVTFFMPEGELKATTMGVGKLFFISGIIPFALGADDLAGYMTLLTAADAFSLLLGIYFGDAIIDIALFYNPELTTSIVKNKWVSWFGALFFIFLGIVSIIDAFRLLL